MPLSNLQKHSKPFTLTVKKMVSISLKDYYGPYNNFNITKDVMENAKRLLLVVNSVLAAAERDGVPLEPNPHTRNLISGAGNGGVRPVDCKVGAPKSAHKRGHAIDIYDPHRSLAAWIWANKARVELLGIRAVERPEWTPTWVHMQDEPVSSGVFAFIPNDSPPLAGALPQVA